MKIKKYPLLALTLALLLLTLSSCTPLLILFGGRTPKTAEEMYNKINYTTSGLSNYKITSSVTIVFYEGDVKYSISSSDVVSVADNNTKNPYYYENVCTTTKSQDYFTEGIVTQILAYDNGMMYFSFDNTREEIGSALCSKATPKEFSEYLASSNEGDFDMTKGEISEISEADDGTRTISFSGYSEEQLTAFKKDVGLKDVDLGAEIKDVCVTVSAQKNFVMKEMKMNVVFSEPEDEDKTPICEMTSVCGNIGEVDRNAEKPDPDQYDQIVALSLTGEIEDMLEEIGKESAGKYKTKITDTVQLESAQIKKSTENTIEFTEEDGKYTYLVTSETDGETVYFFYKDGKQTVKKGEEETENDQTEEEAKDYIKSALCPFYYDKCAVTNIKKDGDFYYVTIDRAGKSLFKQVFESLALTLNGEPLTLHYESSSAEYKIKVTDGKIVSVTGTMTVKGVSYVDVFRASATLTSEVEFLIPEE